MAIACQRCNSGRVAEVSGKVGEGFWMRLQTRTYDGYVPRDIGIGDKFGDYVEFDFCLDCGQIQRAFPLPTTALERGDIGETDSE